MMTKEDMMEFKIFDGITLEELDAIFEISEEVTYSPGEIILEESSYGADSDFYIILQGSVKVEIEASLIHSDTKVTKRLAVLKCSDVFGEMGPLRCRRRSAKVSAYIDLTVRKVDQKKLFQLFVYNPRLGYLFMRNLAAILSDRILDMNFKWRNDI